MDAAGNLSTAETSSSWSIFKNCSDHLSAGSTSDGVYLVTLDGAGTTPTQVYCDMTRNGGGWMLALKTAEQGASWYVQTASVNEADCLDVSAVNNKDCSNINIYNFSDWTEMMGDNKTGGHTAIISKNAARSSLQDHLTGAELSDPNVTPFLSCLLYTSPSPRDGLLSRMPSSA